MDGWMDGWLLVAVLNRADPASLQDAAVKLIDEAIEHTPTLVDLYHVRLRLLLCGWVGVVHAGLGAGCSTTSCALAAGAWR